MSDQIFSVMSGSVSNLIEYIDNGDLALPELQRPFVWANNKVRDLFDSMYCGYPIGYFIIWDNNTGEKMSFIGSDNKVHKTPNMLLIDGQQRLTALYSVIKKKEIKDKNYANKRIKIAFSPVTEEFRVTNAATRRNKEFIDDISELFKSDTYTFITAYLEDYRIYIEEVNERLLSIVEKVKNKEDLLESEYVFCISRLNQIKNPEENILQLTAKLKERNSLFLSPVLKDLFISFFSSPIQINTKEISSNITKLYSLTSYPFQALKIKSTVEEEVVAEVFTRINSKGVTLNQADFILTLVSVFWDEGRAEIDEFCKSARIPPSKQVKDSSYNHIIKPDAKDIVRIIAGFGFKRGKMKETYAILKGRDPDTNKYSEILRAKQFSLFKETQTKVLNSTNWHSFLNIIKSIGYKSSDLIASDNAIINSYIFFLIGKYDHKLDYKVLDALIARWFFMSAITSRYSGSSESIMESDLNKIKNSKSGEEFKVSLDKIINGSLTNDFWSISLPNDLLVTSNSFSPVANAYFASLIYNNTEALFSDKKISDLYDPAIIVKKKPLDKHHIFPKEFLKSKGFELTQINQIANLTYLEFLDNIKISDNEPKLYYNRIKEKYFKANENKLNDSLLKHGISNNFYEMDYSDFLDDRRKNISKLIENHYLSLKG